MSTRHLVVNADDLGMTEGVNAGIVEAHRRGIVTSASLMVKRPEADSAAALAKTVPTLGVGLHIDLTEWEPVDGESRLMYSRADLNDRSQVAKEIGEQLEIFVAMVGRNPDHLDSHQHVHLRGHPREESIRLAKDLGVPLRGIDGRIAFCGQFYGQKGLNESDPEAITKTNLLRLVGRMEGGWMELMCHPGIARGLHSVYASERELELEVLCDPSVREALDAMGVELVSFADLRR